jgi:DNA-binding PadR family transcriptional regulator
MEIENVLLGLIRLHQGVTGYELNRIIKVSTGYLMPASLSHIYPALKRLHDRGLVSRQDIPLNNRPSKKVYMITAKGCDEIQAWLEAPIESALDFKSFYLKMVFSPLMRKETILKHIDREIIYREELTLQRARGNTLELDYLKTSNFDNQGTQLLWGGIREVVIRTEDLRLAWLREYRQAVEKGVKDPDPV